MKNIKIGPKLIVSFLFTAVLSAVMGIYLIQGLKKLSDETAVIYEKGAVPLGLLIETANDMQEMRVQIRNWWIATTPEKRAAALKIIDGKHAALKKSLDDQKSLVITDISRRALEDAKVKIDRFVEEVYKYTNNTTKFDMMGNPLDSGLPDAVLIAGDEMTESVGSVVQIRVNNVRNISEETLEIANLRQNIAIIILAVVLLFSIGLGMLLTLSITSPLGKVVGTISKIENGDMTARVGLERKDELGVLSKAIDNLSARLQTIFKNLRLSSNTIAGSAEELSGIGKQVTNAISQVTANINAMSSEAEQASVSVNNVAGAAEQMSSNMNTIAAAVEEMSSSISQISSNAGDAKEIASQATIKSHEATDTMSKLGKAAKEIGLVTDMIKKIADRTNLLAINASIEAVSAGDTGKGFAVVAKEVKELANQSAQSADDIAQRVESIQADTTEAVAVISGVSEIIEKINHSVESISSYVEQQTKASNEISNNVGQANVGAKRVASSISEVANGSKDIAENAGEAAKSSGNVHAEQINQSSDKLMRIAGDLKNVLEQFRV